MELKLPELGEGVHEGELVSWKVKPGDAVKHDQVLAEIMTDKATVELPSPFEGVVSELVAKEGQTVKVGQTMLKFEGGKGAAVAAPASAGTAPSSGKVDAPRPAPGGSAGAAPGASSGKTDAPRPAPAVAKAPAAPAPASMSAKAPASSGGTQISVGGAIAAAPATRRMARESGVDLGSVAGTGPHGRVMREDIEAFLKGGSGATSAGRPMMARSSGATAPAGGIEKIPFKGLRKKISEKMRQSKDHAAHFTYVEEADATQLVALRKSAKALGDAQGIKVTYLPFVMKAMVAALRKYPIMNAELDEANGEILIKHFYNIALSVQTDDGLTAPVVKNVESKSILQIAAEIQDLVDRARHKKLTMDDLTGGTITLTNAGSIGGLFATPIINYPEVSILGFNKIFRKPVAITTNGREEIVVRDWTYFSISLDHRIVDGAVAAEYMKLFIQYIENPALLVLDSL